MRFLCPWISTNHQGLFCRGFERVRHNSKQTDIDAEIIDTLDIDTLDIDTVKQECTYIVSIIVAYT